MSDCPHYGLKEVRYSDWSGELSPSTMPRAVQIPATRPSDCPRCGMERIKNLREALSSTITIAASLLRMQIDPESRKAANETLTKAIRVFYDDSANWLDPI